MSDRIHDDEPDTGVDVVNALLRAECPQWAGYPLEYLRASGTDNAMWRVLLDDEPGVVVRLPRRPPAAAGVERELATLRHLADTRLRTIVATPSVRHVGRPHDVFPYPWSVLDWIEGSDAWTIRDELPVGSLVDALTQVVVAIGEIEHAPVERRAPGSRGGPLPPLLERLDAWLDDPQWRAPDLIDVAAVRRLGDSAREIVDEPVTHGFVHGDLIPGNLLVDEGRLSAVIDWGGAGWGDPAQDLAPAWSVFGAAERSAFRDALGVDDAAWIRGRTFELEHAVGGVLYYVPKHRPLGDVMSRTLTRILTEADARSS